MTIDKFGQHISKRYQVDTSTLENTIFSNIEHRILNKFKGDQKYVENKIIENFESNLKDDINNLNKRLNENIDDVEKTKKRIKIFEDKTIPEYDDKIFKHEDNLNMLGADMKNEISEIKTIIKISNQSTIDKVKDDISKEFASKFQNFTNILNDRVALEVKNFGKVHEERLLTKLNKSFEIIKTMVVDLENKLTDKIKLGETSIKDNKEEIESFKTIYDESRVNVIRTTTGLKTLKEQFEKQKKEIEAFVRNTSAESINKVIEAREEFNSAIKELKKEIFIDKAVMETEINVKCNEQKNKIQEIDDKINKAIASINDIKDKADKVVK